MRLERNTTVRKQMSAQDKGRILQMFLDGKTQRVISIEIGRNQSSISRIIKRYKESKIFERKKGSGRPRLLSEGTLKRIIREVSRSPRTTTQVLKEEFDLPNVSQRTIRRYLVQSGKFDSTYTRAKPFVSKKNIKHRMRWCKARRGWTEDYWRRVLWSDESPYVLRYNRAEHVWKRKDVPWTKELLTGTVKGDKKIMVWGCFAAHGVGNLYRIPGIMDQYGYQNILENQLYPSIERLFPDGNYIFQQDNDPKHTAIINKNWVRDNHIITMDWPAQSPDLNPIENLWSILDQRLKDRRPQNENELFQVLQNGWNNLPVDLLDKLACSMPNRIKAVIKNRGYPTDY